MGTLYGWVFIKRRLGAGLILIPPEGKPLKYAIALTFPTTNNEAEFEALITGLRLAKGMGIAALKVRSDSELIVNQVNGAYEVKGEKMKKYLGIAKKLVAEIPNFAIEFIPRQENQMADSLSKLAFGGAKKLGQKALATKLGQKARSPKTGQKP